MLWSCEIKNYIALKFTLKFTFKSKKGYLRFFSQNNIPLDLLLCQLVCVKRTF